MKSSVKSLAMALMLAMSVPAMAEIKPLNSVAVEINASIITYGDIERAVRAMRANPANKAIPNAQLAEAAKQQLLERALLVDAAKNQGLKASAAEVDTELNRRAQVGKTSVENIYAQAANMGFSRSAYRLEVAKDLLIERMLAGLQENIKIDDGQIQAYINQAQREGQALPTGSPFTVYQVRRILLNVNDKNTSSAVGERMRLIAQAVRQGSNFGELAQRYSQEAAAANGGVLELTEGHEPEKIEAMLQLLQAGQTSAPIQTAKNWQMLQMIGKRTESNPAKMQREAIYRRLAQQEQQKLQAQFLGQLQQNAVVREY